jgi:hypothetical protein
MLVLPTAVKGKNVKGLISLHILYDDSAVTFLAAGGNTCFLEGKTF